MAPLASSWHRWCIIGIGVAMSLLVLLSLSSTTGPRRALPSLSDTHTSSPHVDDDGGIVVPARSAEAAARTREMDATITALIKQLQSKPTKSSASSQQSSTSSPSSSTDAVSSLVGTIVPSSSSSSSCDGLASKPFTIFVLTYNRPQSLQRLLASLREAHYDDDCIGLSISIDWPRSGDTDDHRAVVAAANAANWTLGPKSVQVHDQNQGLLNQWLNVWQPADDTETGIIFEDDLEPSPYYYRWWKQLYGRYGHLPEIVGLSLQRQYLVPARSQTKLRVDNGNKPFLYLLVGSWGYAPIARQWRQFRSWFGSLPPDFKPLTPGLVTSDWWATFDRQGKHGTMWTQHFIYWCDANKRYTLYANPASTYTLCSNWQEPGLHFGGTPMGNTADHPRAMTWPSEFNQMPDQLGQYDWKAKLTGYLPAPPPAGYHLPSPSPL